VVVTITMGSCCACRGEGGLSAWTAGGGVSPRALPAGPRIIEGFTMMRPARGDRDDTGIPLWAERFSGWQCAHGRALLERAGVPARCDWPCGARGGGARVERQHAEEPFVVVARALQVGAALGAGGSRTGTSLAIAMRFACAARSPPDHALPPRARVPRPPPH
jgi:hypothetical protein